jgi:hypothetical protein
VIVSRSGCELLFHFFHLLGTTAEWWGLGRFSVAKLMAFTEKRAHANRKCALQTTVSNATARLDRICLKLELL